MTPDVHTELARWIFGLSASFHFLFVPLSIGLLLCINLLQTAHAISRRPTLERAATLWSRLFLLTWATGVATGYPLRSQLAGLWDRYLVEARPVFQAIFQIEGLLLWPMVVLVLALSVGRRWLRPVACAVVGWLLLAVMATQSLTILSINAWMQVPHMLAMGRDGWQVDSLAALLLHPTTLQKTWHTLSAALLCGAFFVFALSAALLRQRRELPLARVSVGVAAWVGLLGAGSVMLSGHESAAGVAIRQPMKFAAFEGHWRADAEPAPLVLWAQPDEHQGLNHHELQIPYMMSLMRDGTLQSPPGVLDLSQQWAQRYLAQQSASAAQDSHPGVARMAQVLAQRHGSQWQALGPQGQAAALAQAVRPPVKPVFGFFRLMVACGVVASALCVLAFLQRKRLREGRRPGLMRLLAWAAPLPWIGTLSGWAVAEMGRQPWAVYGQLPTAMAGGVASVGSGVLDLLQLMAAGLLIAGAYAWAVRSVWRAGSQQPHWLDPRVAAQLLRQKAQAARQALRGRARAG